MSADQGSGRMENENITLARRALERLDDAPGQRQHTSFFDLLADDVVLKYAAPAGTPISKEFRGKDAVIEFTNHHNPAEDQRMGRPLEYFANGDRVVALGSISYTIKKTGTHVHDKEFAFILDFRHHKIARILQILDLTEMAEAFRESI